MPYRYLSHVNDQKIRRRHIDTNHNALYLSHVTDKKMPFRYQKMSDRYLPHATDRKMPYTYAEMPYRYHMQTTRRYLIDISRYDIGIRR